jgi:hypothetical protein
MLASWLMRFGLVYTDFAVAAQDTHFNVFDSSRMKSL